MILYYNYGEAFSKVLTLLKRGCLMAKKGKVTIDRELCKGCLLCLRACPAHVLEADTEPNSSGSYPSKAVQTDKCIACGNCYEVCPDFCIEVYEVEGAL
jgi:2-oxoglutarate ferredoxin oxidoreductase subunit delta